MQHSQRRAAARLQRLPLAAGVAALLSLAACSGSSGGDDGTPPITPQPANGLVWGSGTWGSDNWGGSAPASLQPSTPSRSSDLSTDPEISR